MPESFRPRGRTAWATVLLAAALPTGCTVGPAYERPAVTLPEAFRFDASGDVDAADTAWWAAFGDPVLERLVVEAVAGNRDVRLAAARVEEFAARLGIARSAAFPQVDAGGQAQRNRRSLEVAPGAAGGDRTSDFFSATLNVGWELDLWGRIQRASDAARAEILAAEESRRGVVLTLVSSVAQGYIGLRSLDAQLEVAREKLRTWQASLALFERRLERGVISELELAQVRSELERTAAGIPAIERDIARLENSLSVLLCRPPGPIERGLALDELAPPPVPGGFPAELLGRRPDLREAELRLMAATERIGVARADFYPRVSLAAALGLAADDLSRITRGSAGTGQLAAGIAAPLFTGGLLRSRLEQAEAIERQAIEQFQRTFLTALLESEDALVTRSTTIAEVAAQRRQTEALARSAELAQTRYDNGYVGYLEVLDAERDLFDAELAGIRLRASLQASVIGIYKAFGGGWVAEAEAMTASDL